MFDPKQYMIQLKGRDYLPVMWRLVWFREMHPMGGISTEVIGVEPLLVRATIVNENGVILSTAHASVISNEKAVWSGRDIEKAETAAIGRALAHAGFGSQFEAYDEGDYLADSPIERVPSIPPAEAKQVLTKHGETVLARDNKGTWTNEQNNLFWSQVYGLYDNPSHAQNSVNKLRRDGTIPLNATPIEAFEIVQKHIAGK